MQVERKSSYDPVVEAKFRRATADEISNARGYSVWNMMHFPWEVACKVLGTINLARVGPDILKWERSYLQNAVEKVSYWSGYKPEEVFMSTLYTYVIGNVHNIEGSTNVLKALFKQHRNEEIFETSRSMKKFYSILQKTFPDDVFSTEEFMMTCSAKNTKIYRSLLHKTLVGKDFNKFLPEIFLKVQETLEDWHVRCQKGETINVTQETRVFASSLISRLAFQDDSSSEKIAKAVDFINCYVVKTIIKTNTKEDDEKYEEFISVFREAVEGLLKKEELPLFDSSTNDWSPSQKKALISIIFFAGQETTAGLFAWVLRQLALSKEKQETLYQALQNAGNQIPPEKLVDQIDEIKQLFHRSIAEFTPPVGVNRLLKEDVCLEYRLENETEFRKKIMLKGDVVVALLWKKASQDLALDEEELDYKNWLPFGYGVHDCPGKKIAYQQITQFVIGLISKYKVKTGQIDDIPKLGHVTLKLKEDIFITLKPRKNPLPDYV